MMQYLPAKSLINTKVHLKSNIREDCVAPTTRQHKETLTLTKNIYIKKKYCIERKNKTEEQQNANHQLTPQSNTKKNTKHKQTHKKKHLKRHNYKTKQRKERKKKTPTTSTQQQEN